LSGQTLGVAFGVFCVLSNADHNVANSSNSGFLSFLVTEKVEGKESAGNLQTEYLNIQSPRAWPLVLGRVRMVIRASVESDTHGSI
jgi:hypothetical protein